MIYNAPPVAPLSGRKASAAEFTALRISIAMIRDMELSVLHVVEVWISFLVQKAVHYGGQDWTALCLVVAEQRHVVSHQSPIWGGHIR